VSRAIQLGLPQVLTAVEEISDQAGREFSLERSLDKMQADWAGVSFETVQWRSTGALQALPIHLPASAGSHQLRYLPVLARATV
jgi:hypothetical protein